MAQTVTTTSKRRRQSTSNTGEARTREESGHLESIDSANGRAFAEPEEANPADRITPLPKDEQTYTTTKAQAARMVTPKYADDDPLAAPVKERVDVVTPETPTAPSVGIQLVGAPRARVLDSGTKEAPDFTKIVEDVPGPGDLHLVKARLVQEVHYGPHSMPSKQLVMPAGTILGGRQLAELKARVEAQKAGDLDGLLTTRDSDMERGAVRDTQIVSTEPEDAAEPETVGLPTAEVDPKSVNEAQGAPEPTSPPPSKAQSDDEAKVTEG